MKDWGFYTVVILLVFTAGCVVGFPRDFSLSALANLATILSMFITIAALAFAVRTVNTWKKPLQIEIVLEEALKAREIYTFLTGLSVELFDAIDGDPAHRKARLTKARIHLKEKAELIPRIFHSRYTLTHNKSETFVRMENASLGLNFALYDLDTISRKIQDNESTITDIALLNRLTEIRSTVDAFVRLISSHRSDIESLLVRLSEHP